MAKLALKAPETFPGTVSIPVAGGKPVKVGFVFKHRTRAGLDTYLEELRAPRPEGDGAAPIEREVEAVMKVAVGWEMDEPFDADNVRTFLDNYHKAAWAIGNAYINELMQANEGN